VAVVCSISQIAHAAELSAIASIAAPGSTLILPVTLTVAAADVSGVQFDLESDPALIVSVLIGDTARAAGKKAYTATPSPNLTRCLVVGPNQQTIPSGELVRLLIVVHVAAAPRVYNMRFSNVVASDPKGQSVAITGQTIRVEVRSEDTAIGFLQPAGVLNAASMIAGPIAPGEVISLLGPGTAIFPERIPGEELAVRVSGISAPLLYIGDCQINAVVPFGVESSTSATVEVEWQNRVIASVVSDVVPVKPGIFTSDSSGTGPGAILNQDYTMNSFVNPADRGSVIMVFATGLGQTSPAGGDGQLTTEGQPFKVSVTAMIGGKQAELLFAGSAPGLIAGMAQVNVRIPSDAVPSLTTSLVLRAGDATTQPGVTVSVR
jgi:trimeric autotransporter adhesin